eukprot:COSAG02_NODE_1715_length_11211_cov_8.483801_14_plen_168_part_00
MCHDRTCSASSGAAGAAGSAHQTNSQQTTQHADQRHIQREYRNMHTPRLPRSRPQRASQTDSQTHAGTVTSRRSSPIITMGWAETLARARAHTQRHTTPHNQTLRAHYTLHTVHTTCCRATATQGNRTTQKADRRTHKTGRAHRDTPNNREEQKQQHKSRLKPQTEN